MTKSIETLVQDIYALFTNSNISNDGVPWAPSHDKVSEFATRLSNVVASRASERRHQNNLRLSNLGQPDRKLWFTINRSSEGTPLRPEARIKFLFGDILEELLLFLSEEAGHTVEGRQDTIEIAGVKGHRDAVIDGRLVDVKSASSMSFAKFESNGLRSDDPFGYLTQIGAYMKGSENDPLVTDTDVNSFLVIDKTLGKITLDTYPKDSVDYEALVKHKQNVLALSEAPEEKCYPTVPEGKSGNERLGVQCSYCDFKYVCNPGLRTFLYSNGPKYLTKVAIEPRVVEVDHLGQIILKEFNDAT